MSGVARRRHRNEPDMPGVVANPLLVDWLDSEPGARSHLARVLVVGTPAEAEIFSAAEHVAQLASPDLISTPDVFDLVVAVDCLRTAQLGGQLDRLARAVADTGRLLVIAVTDGDRPDVLTAAQLQPLRSAGLRPVAFDELTETGPSDRSPGRWLRALYQRGAAPPPR